MTFQSADFKSILEERRGTTKRHEVTKQGVYAI